MRRLPLPAIHGHRRLDIARPLTSWLCRSLEGWARTPSYSAEEVQQRLRSADPHDPRTAAVQTAASQTAAWSSLLPARAARDLGPAAARLPAVVFWYRRGVGLEEIGRRLSPFGGAWDAERSVQVACQLIARLLNRTQARARVAAR